MSVRHHLLDIYGVHLHLATNQRDWSTLRRKHKWLAKKPNSSGLAHFATLPPKKPGPVIPHLALWVDMSRCKDPLELVEICSHEASHGAAQILDWIGHEVRGSDEPSAYLVGWLTRWMHAGCTEAEA